MDSPQMYDSQVDEKYGLKSLNGVRSTGGGGGLGGNHHVSGINGPNNQANNVTAVPTNGSNCLFGDDSVTDIGDLNASEISLDIQRFIEDPAFSESVQNTLFGDILPDNNNNNSNKSVVGGVDKEVVTSVSSALSRTATSLLSTLTPVSSSSTTVQQQQAQLQRHPAARSSPSALYMPQAVNYGTERAIAIKQEPAESDDYINCRQQTQQQQHRLAGGDPAGHSGSLPIGHHHHHHQHHNSVSSGHVFGHAGGLVGGASGLSGGYSAAAGPTNNEVGDAYGKSLAPGKVLHKQSKKFVDKGSDEYRRRRERNNIAVRKSREKAKLRSRETEHKVKELQRENERLKKRVESLSKEVNVLRTVFSNVGLPPEHLQRELANTMDDLHAQ